MPDRHWQCTAYLCTIGFPPAILETPMSVVTPIATSSVRDNVSAEEWQARVDLAACYRLAAHYGWTDLILTHISARVPDTEDQFLLNPFGLMFEEVTASSLVKLDTDGEIVMESPYTINAAGFTIHSAVHDARHDVDCVMHTHTVAGMAISAQKHGLLPLSQTGFKFYGNLGYHDYEGVAFDITERERLVESLGDHMAMILRNHGLLACGRNIADAFYTMHSLEKACAVQLAAQAGGELVMPSEVVCRHVAQQFQGAVNEDAAGNLADLAWTALRRKLDRVNPGYDA
jgi:ribulose-5-phosphate 4-epimerase/fuculose-1-phosphate aldolase